MKESYTDYEKKIIEYLVCNKDSHILFSAFIIDNVVAFKIYESNKLKIGYCKQIIKY